MEKARDIAARLLENDDLPPEPGPDDVDPKHYVQTYVKPKAWVDEERAKVTAESAARASGFYHRTQRRKNGQNIYVRANGRIKTWKTRPGEFRVPWKYGLYEYGDITHHDAHEWSLLPMNPPQRCECGSTTFVNELMCKKCGKRY